MAKDMNVINYAFNTEGVEKLNYTFRPAVKDILSILVQIQDNQVLMNIQVENIFDGDDLAELHKFFVNWSVAFGFEIDVPIWEPRYCGHSLSRKDGTRNTLINAGPLTFTIPRSPVSPSKSQMTNILNMSQIVTSQSQIYLKQFAFANAEPNPISRYTFLYNLLLSINNDKQAKVDTSILTVAPTCNQSISPNNGKIETLYTRLRNELAHIRDGVSFNDTKVEIEKEISDFGKIVKEIVGANISRKS